MEGKGFTLLILSLSLFGSCVGVVHAEQPSQCGNVDFCAEVVKGYTFCNDDVEIRAQRLSLEGTISSNIGKFTSARILSLKGNILSDKIPSEIGQMDSMTGLALSTNYLTGSIPEEFYRLSNLGWVDLSDNPLSGTLMPNISDFTRLSSLELFKTRVHGTIPSEIGLLKKAQWIFMYDNDFSGSIPREIVDLPDLRKVFLSGSKNLCNPGIVFDKTVEHDFDAIPLCPGTSKNDPVLRNVTKSAMDTNGDDVLPSVSDDCLSDGCDGGLRCNENTGFCEMPNIFGETYDPDTLEISARDCGLAGAIPERFCELKQLRKIELSQNYIIGEIPDCIFELSMLTHLSLGLNKIRGTIPKLIGRLTGLTYLNLGQSEMSGQLPSEIGQLTNLKHLDIKKMDLTGTLVSEIGNLANLEWFEMNENEKFGKGDGQKGDGSVGSLPSQIGNLTSLKHLNINDLNFIGNLPSQIGKLKRLTLLKMGGSFDEPESGLPSELGNLYNLAFLDFKRSKFKAPIPPQIGRLKRLTELQAKRSGVTGTLPTEFGSLESLRVVSLENNDLSGELPTEIGLLSELRRLAFASNTLSHGIPSQFGRLSSLRYIDLRGNELNMSIPSELGLLNSTRVLFLGSNELTGKIPSEIGKLGLYQLDLSKNSGISGTLPNQIGRLHQLRGSLAVNAMLNGTIPSSLGNLDQLDILDLHENSLTGEIPESLGKMNSLRVLSLRNNLLDGGIPSTLTNLEKVGRLELGNNPLKLICDCRLLSWFPDFVETIIYDSADVIGCSPDNDYQGLAVHTLKSDKRAPCSHATFQPDRKSSSTSNSLDINWNYSTWINSAALSVSQFDSVNARKPILSPTLRENVRPCEAFWISIGNLNNFTEYGFEFSVNPGGTRECVFANDVHIGPNEFGYTLNNLNAFSLYDISIRPIFFERGELVGKMQRITFVYGPRSSEIQKKTLPSIPSEPLHVTSPSARERQLVIQWVRPKQPNGIVSRYYIEIEPEEGIAFTVPTKVSSDKNMEADTFETIEDKLNPDSVYNVRVQAETIAGKSNWSAPLKIRTCPENMRRQKPEDDCFSTIGYFQNGPSESLECEGILNFIEPETCFVNRVTIETLRLREGFWRESLSSTNIRKCPIPEFCEQTSNNVNTTDQYCTDRHTGVYCESCEKPYVLVSGEGCIECTEEKISKATWILATVWIWVVLITLISITFLVFRSKKSRSKKKKEKLSKMKGSKFVRLFRIVRKGSVGGVKLRIIFGFFQVFMGFSNTFLSTALAQASRNMLNFVFNFNYGGLLSVIEIECAWDFTHYDILFIYTLFPICFLAVLKLIKKVMEGPIGKNFNVSKYTQDTDVLLLGIMFLIYPGVSNAIFATFDCEKFEEADGVLIPTSALRVDYSLECNADPMRVFTLFFASLMVLVYPIGILIVYSLVLGVFSKQSPDVRNENKAVKMLTHPYKQSMYWYELFELSRKLVQTSLALGLFSVDQQNFAVNALASLIVAVIYLCIAIRLDAYEDYSDFLFAIVSLTMLCSLCLLVLFAEVSSELIDVNVGLISIVAIEVLIFVGFYVFSIWKVWKGENESGTNLINPNTENSATTTDGSPKLSTDQKFIQKMNDEVEMLYAERQSKRTGKVAMEEQDSALGVKIVEVV